MGNFLLAFCVPYPYVRHMKNAVGNTIVQLARFGFWPTLALVTLLSLWPGGASPPSSPWSDKIGHGLAYFTLGVLVFSGWYAKPIRFWMLALAALLGWSGLLEVLQGIPQLARTTSILDILANAGGLFLALLLLGGLRWVCFRTIGSQK